ncbi:MAG TPA: GNAT family N-acetyltransferase [Candidatus Polarisedimenticolaceae bacterium]|nr:GNAT family N-acetyltransferase [Candidatus Polarisedimenticolaceae bacterium]
MEWTRPPYRISDRPDELDLDRVHAFLATSYWARGIPRDTIERSVRHSLAFGLFDGHRQIGFARVISDRATFAYLADVYVAEEARGRGLGLWLVETALAHPDLRGLRRWLLATRDAHDLYLKVGFTPLADPSILMTIHDPDIYLR